MTVTFVEFRLDYPFLQEALQRVPGMEIEWVRNVAADSGREMLFWAHGDDFDAFDAAIEADPTVRLLDSTAVGEERIYRVVLLDRDGKSAAGLYPVLIETASFIQSATATHEGWCCHFGFPDRSALDRFFRACRERDIEYEIERLVEGRGHDVENANFGLTDVQRETLIAAVENGFFEVPRQCTLDELGDGLGVSDTAASMRLRRGMKTLVERTVSPPGNGT
jgi:hypothetical protein